MFQIGFGAGGSTDTMGRVIAKVMEEQTGWNIVVENKGGGGGVAMFTGISKAKPNGQVIGMGVSTPILMQLVTRPEKLPFKVDDFDYLSSVARGELAIVAGKDAPFDDLESLVEYARTSGPVPIAINASPQKLVMGAVANAERHAYAPDVMTVAEQGYGVYRDPYFYVATTKGTDPAIIGALSKALSNALATDEVEEIVRNAARTSVLDLDPEQTRAMMVDGLPVIEKLVGK